MKDHVDALLSLWRSSQFEWGEADCLLSIGDYIASRGGKDVTPLFRGTYDDEAGALAHVAAYAGPANLIELTGLPRAERPKRGDVILFDAGVADVPGVCTGPGVAVRRERGVAEINLRFVSILAVWSVP